MAEIPIDRAKTEDGIVTFHEVMANGERRFRLKKSDGTAYIRTEASAGSGWQGSHFHRHVRETYIVQAGWMAFAELVDGALSLCLFEANEIVTSRPGIVHNVYLPDGAVIHTVKHGSASGSDRLTDETTKAFDKVTHALTTEAGIRAAAIRRRKAKPAYTDEYRHFDNLIWQVPAWSTAIFALSIQALFEVLGEVSSLELKAAAGLSIFTALCLACFSFVMMRFRTHQRRLKGYAATPAWFSASTLTQSLITIESAILFGIALLILAIPDKYAIGFSALLAVLMIVLFERSVRRTTIRSA